MEYKQLPRKGKKLPPKIQPKKEMPVKKTGNPLSTVNIIKGAAKGVAKDVVKLTTGLGKGGAATEMIKKGAKNIGTSTGYMIRGTIDNMKEGAKNKGFMPRTDYTKWDENIKKGRAMDNLK